MAQNIYIQSEFSHLPLIIFQHAACSCIILTSKSTHMCSSFVMITYAILFQDMAMLKGSVFGSKMAGSRLGSRMGSRMLGARTVVGLGAAPGRGKQRQVRPELFTVYVDN